jgi:hypothetical protein
MNISDEAKELVATIGESIEYYLNKYPIDMVYDYDIVINSTLFKNDNAEIQKINNLKSKYEKNRLLKYFISKKLKDAINKLDYYNWIVSEWGGIKNFGKNVEDKVKIRDIEYFFECIQKGELNYKQFNTISSYSKIISFTEPNNYFIYDSRVAYVLNWFLLKNYKQKNHFFIIPSGRNSDLIKYNMDTIINLYEKGNIKEYYDKKYTYFVYCDFIKKLFEKTKNDEVNEPYYIEMMLWGLFNKVIQEIKNNVKIVIK